MREIIHIIAFNISRMVFYTSVSYFHSFKDYLIAKFVTECHQPNRSNMERSWPPYPLFVKHTADSENVQRNKMAQNKNKNKKKEKEMVFLCLGKCNIKCNSS
jgi:hypothetical protein